MRKRRSFFPQFGAEEDRITIAHIDAVFPVSVAQCVCSQRENSFVVCASHMDGREGGAKEIERKLKGN